MNHPVHRLAAAWQLRLVSILLVALVASKGKVDEEALEQQAPAYTAPTPGVCSERCYDIATCNEELGGRCDCPKTLSGSECHQKATKESLQTYGQSTVKEAKDPLPCLNDCNGRGTCVYGACVCTRGNFTSDCSVSLGPDTQQPVVLAGSGYEARRKRPLIYVYDIPHKLSSWHNVMRADRGLAWVFWQRLLGAGVLTTNGDEADWFYIPVKLRSTSDGYSLKDAVSYIRSHWPWFERYGGNRHFVLHSGDTGRGEVTGAIREDATLANITWLHHWGLTEDYPSSGWRKAHRVGKDVVVPIYLGVRKSAGLLPLSGLHPLAPRIPRNGTFLFSGRICGDHSLPDPEKPWPHCATRRSPGYSQGARQLVHFHHSQRPGYKVMVKNKEYQVDLINYKWCLAPSGGGHGHRQVLVAAMGCLPVVVSDLVMQPFEPEMDWSAFSLRVEQKDVPTLHEAIEAVDEHKYEEMQDALRCAAQHMIFSTMSGAFMQEDGKWDAFGFVLEILRMQQGHPGLHPSKYAEVDEQYRDFLNCGDPDGMASYGRKLRETQLAKYPTAPSLSKDPEKPMDWSDVYRKATAGFKKLVDAHRLPAEGSEPEPPLPLCSMSLWDPEQVRCSKVGHRERVHHSYIPGGAACVMHKNLAECPRLWE
ncbi:hypothetical protein CHLRE_12g502450v5 [Chlamydomonas reinhardtii]|uniref:EGF-like domain-containing protein n=1 Tax=Chlamydomonas reinhardtii TaxID=3055 RepID=A0A2K3D342_CHLRE|nr:uncharacterized protein CHLRE_12g502450v5 [Chlamydomonas reinhardtii]PNW74962.1 hypothetical protein CHLRE_12g502450v5 [Chlamydomonas reinhardtii]